MQDKLKWNAIGLARKTKLVRDYIHQEKIAIPVNHTVKHGVLQKFLVELDHILRRIEKIEKILIPKLEDEFRLKFKTPELLLIAMSNTSIRNIFEDLKTHFKKDPNRPLQDAELTELASSGDASKVLALIGDSALDLAIVQVLWDSSLSTTGKLTEKRKEVASNRNLAKYCDQWGLFGYCLNRFRVIEPKVTKPETILHEKGTLVEAILGVVYLEFDLEVLRGVVPLIQ